MIRKMSCVGVLCLVLSPASAEGFSTQVAPILQSAREAVARTRAIAATTAVPERGAGVKAMLARYADAYLGFSTIIGDGSEDTPYLAGEMAVIIDASGVHFRQATGKTVISRDFRYEGVGIDEQLTTDEALVFSVKLKKTGDPVVVAINRGGAKQDDPWGMILLAPAGDVNIPIGRLFSSKQVRDGLYQKDLDEIRKEEEEAGRMLYPRLPIRDTSR